MIVDLQLNPATTSWNDYLECSLLGEQRGFGALWVYDHLAGSTLRGRSMFEATALLGGLAMATSRIQIGSMVINAGLRPPAVVAAAMASVQTMSGGRLLVGLGAGAAPGSRWSGELDVAGIDIRPTTAARHQRVAETISMCDEMWAGRLGSAGFPQATPRPPIIVGVNSAALTLVGATRADGINVLLSHARHAEFVDLARAETEGKALITITVWAHPGDPAATARGIELAIALEPDRLIMALIGTATTHAVERLADLALAY
jgi:alkanesulfonate monooxygenase SsuD/methylene tetrahydromethanopterin reductase-like flavin-dependent oxidoreductase (luciferase family)